MPRSTPSRQRPGAKSRSMTVQTAATRLRRLGHRSRGRRRSRRRAPRAACRSARRCCSRVSQTRSSANTSSARSRGGTHAPQAPARRVRDLDREANFGAMRASRMHRPRFRSPSRVRRETALSSVERGSRKCDSQRIATSLPTRRRHRSGRRRRRNRRRRCRRRRRQTRRGTPPKPPRRAIAQPPDAAADARQREHEHHDAAEPATRTARC